MLFSLRERFLSWLCFPLILTKLLLLHLGYVFLGIDQEYFHIHRGNCFHQLGLFSLALGNYKTALFEFESQDEFLKSAIGYCYAMLGNYRGSLEFYREAYLESRHPDILIGLVYAELNCGNQQNGVRVFDELLQRHEEFDDFHRMEVERIRHRMDNEGIAG
jgi:tetratricopeptide (TPR) repeat protein